MRKLRFSMLGMFCAGLLLIGIGAGVTFIEFTELSYEGKRLSVKVKDQEESFTAKLPDNEDAVTFDFSSGSGLPEITSQASDLIPAGSINVKVAYKSIGPKVSLPPSGIYGNNFYIGFNSLYDFSVMMIIKDEVMQSLKNGKIGEYIPAELTKVIITYNPADAARIQLPMSGTSV